MNAPHEEAVEFAKISKRENRVYVGNLSYDVKYRDLLEFMRGGGWKMDIAWIFSRLLFGELFLGGFLERVIFGLVLGRGDGGLWTRSGGIGDIELLMTVHPVNWGISSLWGG